MYTRIPVQKAIDITLTHLRQVNQANEVIEDFKVLLSQCIDKNLCVFRETTYQFPDGLPMGGPLSALIAEIYLDFLETEILKSSTHSRYGHVGALYARCILCLDWQRAWHSIILAGSQSR